MNKISTRGGSNALDGIRTRSSRSSLGYLPSTYPMIFYSPGGLVGGGATVNKV